MKKQCKHDVIIIGGGISGCALVYLLSRYTSLKNIALFEKYPTIASVNSHARNNSQTLHCGDIETNYTLEKACQVKQTANMVVKYAQLHNTQQGMLYKYPKMVIAVGDECQSLSQRYEQFKSHFPNMQLLQRDAIKQIEPAVIEGRKDDINAIAITDEYTAVNFQVLSQSFVQQAQQNNEKIDIFTSTLVKDIQPSDEGYIVKTSQGEHHARFVVVSAGGHSLLFAQQMGFGQHFSCLPMAGSFYYTPEILNGKVYTVQNDKLPFAAIHGDPDVVCPGKTRFGPTALALPLLERYRWSTFTEFLKVFKPDRDVMKCLWGLIKQQEIRNYMLKNMLFEIPVIRERLFLKDVRKIVPTLRLNDISFASKTGGIRPVMIDKEQHTLHLGEAQINPNNGLIFNMTPSPGATSCLGNAEKDLRYIVDYLGAEFDEAALVNDLK